MTVDTITQEIYEVLLKYYPDLSKYHSVNSLSEMVQYFDKLHKTKDWRYLSYREKTQVDDLNDIRDQIKRELIKNNDSDYNDGVLATIRLIEHRVHSICDI